MNKFLSLSLLLLTSMPARSCPDNATQITPELCATVLNMAGVMQLDDYPATVESTRNLLEKFFADHNIRNYTDAAHFGRTSAQFQNPEAFTAKIKELFVENTVDVCPGEPKHYQAIIFNTSGVDTFMERLALLSRLVKANKVTTDEVIALVGNYPHRQDFKNAEYLAQLPTLFAQDFDLASADKQAITEIVRQATEQEGWKQQDGMDVAWKLVASDAVMAKLREKFRYSIKDTTDSAALIGAEESVDHLIAHDLRKPASPENPIAFVANSQAAHQVKALVAKKFPENNGAVDVLVARPAAPEIECALFNDTPQQRAMVKLFNFYRMLQTASK